MSPPTVRRLTAVQKYLWATLVFTLAITALSGVLLVIQPAGVDVERWTYFFLVCLTADGGLLYLILSAWVHKRILARRTGATEPDKK